MNLGRTVFSQIMEHLPEYEFQKCVARYRRRLTTYEDSLVGTSICPWPLRN
jgi:hypothetical protein